MSDDLIEDDFTNRPDNDDQAFHYYEKRFRAELDAAMQALQKKSSVDYWDSYNYFMQTYVNRVLAVVDALDLDVLEHWVNNPTQANDQNNFQQIKFDIDAVCIKLKVRYAQRVRKSSVHLGGDARNKIRDLINKIKLTIEGIDISLARKEALMGKLNAFATEVDTDRTRFEAFGALMIEAAGMVGKLERTLRPVRGWIDSIAKLLHEANVLEDNRPRVPSSARRIEAPRKRISPPSSELWASTEAPKPGGDRDDEIP